MAGFFKNLFSFEKNTKTEPEALPIKENISQTCNHARQPKLSWLERMRKGLSESTKDLSDKINTLFHKKKLDSATLDELKAVLLQADLGIGVTNRIIYTLSLDTSINTTESPIDHSRFIIASEIEKILTPVAQPLTLDLSYKPHVILVAGVNGTGKTTTIGKITAKLQKEGLSVMLAAADTFRAAAVEQLAVWSKRTSSPLIAPQKPGADPAGLAYEALQKAQETGSDVLIIDTAGRLQNKTELMAELEKIIRTLKKRDAKAPHTVLQTIDATTGQNALDQVEVFSTLVGVNGLVLTKLDATKRAGILVALAQKHKLPIYFIGVGEELDDLQSFSASEFAKTIVGIH